MNISHKTEITREELLHAQAILHLNGVDLDETATVLQAMLYVMLDVESEDELDWDGDEVREYAGTIANDEPSDIEGKENVCPICGCTDLEYGAMESDDDGGKYPWECPKCGSTGEEGFTRSFDGKHYCVRSDDGYEFDENEHSREDEEGICPMCGNELSYDGREDLDDGGFYEWICTGCEATGREGFDNKFDGTHYNVVRGEGCLRKEEF